MKIVYLHQYFNTPAMAGGTRSYEMARRLVEWGHEVHMITSWRQPTEHNGWFQTEEAGIHVHWLPVPYSNKFGFVERIKAFVTFAWGAARKAAALPADVVFATSTPLTIALPGAYAAMRQKVPMVFEVRDLWPAVPIAIGALRNRLTISLALWLERFAYRRSARVVALAPGMREGICATGYPVNQTAIIPNGADIQQFQEVSGNTLDVDHPWVSSRLIVYVGTVGPANGVEYIPHLAAAIRRLDPATDIRFAVLGDGRCLADVKILARKLNVFDSMVFFPGQVAKQEVPAWLAKSTATIMTYDGPELLYRDSVSNKFFDSLAASRPVLANFRGFSTVVAEAFGAGAILPKGEINLAAVRCRQLLNDETWLLEAGRAGLRLAYEYFERERLARDLEKILQEAVALAPVNLSEPPIGQIYAELWSRYREQVSGKIPGYDQTPV